MQLKRYIEPYGVFGAMVGDIDQPRASFVVSLIGDGATLDKGGQRASYYDGEQCSVSALPGWTVTSIIIEGGGTITELPYTFMVTRNTNITVTAQPVIPEPLAFATDSWATIASAAESGVAQQYYNVGDEKTVQLSTDEEVTLVILGFNHDDLSDGSGKAVMTIGMKNLLATKYGMNETSINEGGWDESEMRTSTMATLLSQLPSDLQGVIKQVNKKATAGSQSKDIIVSADKLWLFAEVEIDATTLAGYVDEGKQYEYWKTIKDGKYYADRIKYLSNGNGSTEDWWLRSPNINYNNRFQCIQNNGNIDYVFAFSSKGVSFGFCI